MLKSLKNKALRTASYIPLLNRIIPTADAVTNANQRKRGALNDTNMRDLILSLVRDSNINFNNMYLKATEGEQKAHPELESWDGLIMRPEGYFRMAVEPDTGIKVLLYEFEPHHLIGRKDKDGHIGFANLDQCGSPDAPNVYRIKAFDPNTDQTVMQDALNSFCKDFRNNIIPDLDLYLRDEAHYSSDKAPQTSETFRAANEDFAFGLYRDTDHKWQSIMHSRMRGNHDQSGQFERISERERGRSSFAREIFRMNVDDLKTSESFGGILKHTLQYWGINSHKKFKGQNSLSDNMTAKMIISKKGLRGKVDYTRVYLRQQFRRAVRWTSGFIGSRYKEYGMSAGVGLALSLKGFKFSALRAAGFAVLTAIGATFFGKFIDEQTQKGLKTFFRNKAEYNEMKKKLPQNRDYSRFFDAQTPENKLRPLKKIAPALIPRLRLLNHAQSGVMNSMDKTVAITRSQWKDEYLGGLETRMFGKANMAICGNSVLKILPNGVMALTHINKEFNTVSKYYTYNEDFVASKSAPLHPQVKDMLSNYIYKVVDDRSRAGLKASTLSAEDFSHEMDSLYNSTIDIHGQNKKLPCILSKLFNAATSNGDQHLTAHEHIPALLSAAAKVEHQAVIDSLDALMALSKDLRDEKSKAGSVEINAHTSSTSSTASTTGTANTAEACLALELPHYLSANEQKIILQNQQQDRIRIAPALPRYMI